MAAIYSFVNDTVPGCVRVNVDEVYKGDFPKNKTTIKRGAIYTKIHCEGEEPISLLPENIAEAETHLEVLNAVIEAFGGVAVEED